MLAYGVAMILLGMCGTWFENWLGYVLAFVMAAGVLITMGSIIVRAFELLMLT